MPGFPQTWFNLNDSAIGELSAEISASATSLALKTGQGAKFPASNFVVKCQDERVLCASRSGDTLSSLTRGFDSSSAVLHPVNSVVFQSADRALFQRIYDMINGHTHPQLECGVLRNCSVADQTINAATTANLAGSEIVIPATKLQIGTVFKYRLSLSKTNAGTASNSFAFQLGTAGTTADPDIITFAMPVGTAVVDTGQIDITVTIRGPLSASCIAQGLLRMTHNLNTTGLATVGGVALKVTSGAFNATTDNLIASLRCTTAASTVLTFQQVTVDAVNL